MHSPRLAFIFPACSTQFPVRRGQFILSHSTILRFYDQGPEAILRLVSRLENQIEELTAQLAANPQPLIASLSKELKLSKQTLEHQSQQLITERQLNHQLLRRIRELEQEVERATPVERDSHNSSLPPALDLPWKKISRTRSLRKKTGKQVGGQFGHQGATLRQSAQPHHVIIHLPEACAGCGMLLHQSEPQAIVRRQVFDICDGRIKVTEHRAETRRCPQCTTISKAKFPPAVRAPVQYGPGVLSRSVYLHLYQLIPVARTAETMKDLFECRISVATIQRAARVSSGKLVNTEQRIKAVIRDSEVIGVDETGLRVAGQGAYIHVARTEGLTHYAYDERRGKAAMDEIGILPQFKGTLVRDCYLSYSRFEQCQHSLCNAHLLRELVFIEEVDSKQKVWATPLSKLLVQIKDAATQARAHNQTQVRHQQQESWLVRYQQLIRKAEKINPLPSPSKDAAVAPQQKRDQKPSPGNIIKRLQRRRDEILRFMTDLSVPFDNNGSERDLRMVKLQQKISGCFRTSDGARNFCRVRSYLSTARKQGYSLLCSLERALNGKPLVFQ